MNAIPFTPLILDLARRIVWFEAPERALSDPIRFMAYAMTYARHEDMREIRRYVSNDDIREALDNAPPGIIDPRSWAYWNCKMGRYPVPPAPVRKFNAPVGPEDRRLPLQDTMGRQESGAKLDLEVQQRKANRAGQKKYTQAPTKHELEEVRRQARESWRDKCGKRK